MFFSKRTVPQTPPSLVILSSHASGVNTASDSSTPSNDHVPLDRYAQSSPGVAGTAATAHAVSWPPGAMTGIPCTAAGNVASAIPPYVAPAGRTSGRICVGIPRRSRTSTAHVPVVISSIWLVLAIVYSDASTPVKRPWRKSGMKSNFAVAASCSAWFSARLASWKRVLIGIVWMPVTA